MPDSIPAVGAQIKGMDPNQGMSTLSGILGIQQQRQQIAANAAELQKAQQLMKERQGIQAMMQSGKDDQGNSILGDDGEPDASKIIPAIGRIAPLSGQQYAQNIIKTASEKVALRAASTNLDADQRQLTSGVARAQIGTNNSAEDFQKSLQPLLDKHPEMATTIKYAGNLAKVIDAMKDPAQRDKAWLHLAQQLENPTEVAAQQAPSTTMVQAPTGLQPVQTNQNAPGGIGPNGPLIRQGISPEFIRLPNGQVVPAGAGQGGMGSGAGGGRAPVAPAPGEARTAAQDAPPPNAPTAVQDAYRDAVKNTKAHTDEVRHNDADYGLNRHINQQILKLSNDTDTGPGTDVWHHALGAIAGPFGGNNVADYQTIGAYLDRQAALSTRQMGLPDTNAGLATAASLSGTTGYQKNALQTKVKLTDALVEGAHQYRIGLDKVAGFSGQPSPVAVDRYRAAWAANFDPTVYLYKNADKAERKVIASHLTPQQAATLKKKAQALDALSQGAVP